MEPARVRPAVPMLGIDLAQRQRIPSRAGRHGGVHADDSHLDRAGAFDRIALLPLAGGALASQVTRIAVPFTPGGGIRTIVGTEYVANMVGGAPEELGPFVHEQELL